MAKDRGAEVQERPMETVGVEEPKEKRDCRMCVHYPLKRRGINTTMSECMKEATKNYTRMFCGKKPQIEKGKRAGQPLLDGLDCTGKSFERAQA